MLMALVTPDSGRTNELSEDNVINVLELVLNEHPVDRASVFLTGRSKGQRRDLVHRREIRLAPARARAHVRLFANTEWFDSNFRIVDVTGRS